MGKMYKLLSIEKNQVTRDLLLENLGNHTHETCFDDSILLDFKNFDFMEIGQIYECKILSFGDLIDRIQKKVGEALKVQK